MSVSELKKYGLEELREEEVYHFLETQEVGVLGLAGGRRPYLLPLSYGYDGGESLYFTYLLGETSEKEELTERAESGTFLVYKVDTLFNWESVLLEGDLSRVPQSQWTNLEEILADVWRPEIFRTAETSRNLAIYEFEIAEANGIKHTGLAPGYQD